MPVKASVHVYRVEVSVVVMVCDSLEREQGWWWVVLTVHASRKGAMWSLLGGHGVTKAQGGLKLQFTMGNNGTYLRLH